MKHFNYQSDFKIEEPLKNDAPFRYTYFTKKIGKVVVAEYDGTEYKNCIARDGKLTVPIEHGSVGLGEVKVKREYFLTDSDFADGVCDFVTDNVPTDIEVWRGPTDAAEVVHVDVAPYYTKGDKGDKGEGANIYGTLNLTDLDAVKAAQNGLGENEVRFFVISDSEGKIPSKQKCYDVPSDVVRQMSLKTGNSIVDLALSNVEVEPIGVSVGDLIALTKVSVKLSDLAEAVGVNISLSGSILIYQHKIIHTSGAREENYEEGCTKGVYGLLSPWDKMLIEGSAKPTRYGYGHNPDDMLLSGVLAYTSATIDGVTANWTIFVDCSASPDGGGFFHLTQTAVGRDSGNLGEVYMRLGYYQKGGAATFTPWRHTTGSGSGSGSGGYEPPVGGIPRADLSDDVQASLGKADTALQEALSENLLLNARFGNNAEKWDGSNYQVVNDIHSRGVSGVKLDDGYVIQNVDAEEGYYTLSFWHTGLSGENYVSIPSDCEDFESDLGEVGGGGEFILPNHDIPKKYTIRFYSYDNTLTVAFEAGGEMSISEVKLEKSKKASDFSLNALDIADRYSVPTKDEVATAISQSITNALNTEV